MTRKLKLKSKLIKVAVMVARLKIENRSLQKQIVDLKDENQNLKKTVDTLRSENKKNMLMTAVEQGVITSELAESYKVLNVDVVRATLSLITNSKKVVPV